MVAYILVYLLFCIHVHFPCCMTARQRRTDVAAWCAYSWPFFAFFSIVDNSLLVLSLSSPTLSLKSQPSDHRDKESKDEKKFVYLFVWLTVIEPVCLRGGNHTFSLFYQMEVGPHSSLPLVCWFVCVCVFRQQQNGSYRGGDQRAIGWVWREGGTKGYAGWYGMHVWFEFFHFFSLLFFLWAVRRGRRPLSIFPLSWLGSNPEWKERMGGCECDLTKYIVPKKWK